MNQIQNNEAQLLSLIVPCFNEALSIPLFFEEIVKIQAQLPDISTEIIFVDDGSSDDTLTIIQDLSQKYDFVRFVSFSRNFGKESAILAGLKESRGNWVAVMDADLQDPPAMLPTMLHAVRVEGYDCVGTRRCTRKGEPVIRSLFAKLFYIVINKMASIKLVDGARDYKLLSRPAVDALIAMPEVNRFSKGLYEWIGFRTKWLEFENIERIAGETKWSFWKLLKYSVEGILAFSTTPLIVSIMLGLFFMAISFFAIVFLVIRQYLYQNSASGWTSLVCIVLLLSGVQLFCTGIMGQYISKIYTEIKRRPHYIISKSSTKK